MKWNHKADSAFPYQYGLSPSAAEQRRQQIERFREMQTQLFQEKQGKQTQQFEAPSVLLDDSFLPEQLELDIAKVFPVMVIATMSGGKSTLINAMLGTEILPSRNTACTAKIYSILDDDMSTAPKLYITSYDGETRVVEENLPEVLENANNDDAISSILISGQIEGVLNTGRSMMIIDTPGPNNAADSGKQERDITEATLKKLHGGMILYIMNATQQGICDDQKLLQTVAAHLKQYPYTKIVFALNKIDELDFEKETLHTMLLNAKAYLEKNGFHDSTIVPVSALAAILFKKALAGETLSRKQKQHLERACQLFCPENLPMAAYVIENGQMDASQTITIGGAIYNVAQLNIAIENTGIPYLERYIQECQIGSSCIDHLSINMVEKPTWQDRRVCGVNLISSMSSGKSTLLNAFLGAELLPAENQACTATITEIIDDDSAKGVIGICYADLNKKTIVHPQEEITAEQMRQYNQDEKVRCIELRANIPFASSNQIRLLLRDTAGSNGFRMHHDIAKGAIADKNALVLYVLNATQLKVEDDYELLRNISEKMNESGQWSHDRFIFVVNKCDALDDGKNKSVKKCETRKMPTSYPLRSERQKIVEEARKYLESFGIIDPIIIPTSAYAALILRKHLAGEPLNRKERSVRDYQTDHIEYPELHFEKYAVLPPTVREKLEQDLERYHKAGDTTREALIHTGIPAVEAIINEYIKHFDSMRGD